MNEGMKKIIYKVKNVFKIQELTMQQELAQGGVP